MEQQYVAQSHTRAHADLDCSKCAVGSTCKNSACVATCPAPSKTCNGQCINVLTDPNNCGDCGTKVSSFMTLLTMIRLSNANDAFSVPLGSATTEPAQPQLAQAKHARPLQPVVQAVRVSVPAQPKVPDSAWMDQPDAVDFRRAAPAPTVNQGMCARSTRAAETTSALVRHLAVAVFCVFGIWYSTCCLATVLMLRLRVSVLLCERMLGNARDCARSRRYQIARLGNQMAGIRLGCLRSLLSPVDEGLLSRGCCRVTRFSEARRQKSWLTSVTWALLVMLSNLCYTMKRYLCLSQLRRTRLVQYPQPLPRPDLAGTFQCPS